MDEIRLSSRNPILRSFKVEPVFRETGSTSILKLQYQEALDVNRNNGVGTTGWLTDYGKGI
jgi:hypothetical protein